MAAAKSAARGAGAADVRSRGAGAAGRARSGSAAGERGAAEELGAGGQEFLLRETGCADLPELSAQLDRTIDTAGTIVDAILEAAPAQQG